MRRSFVGILLSPPPLPALERRVDYMSMKKKTKTKQQTNQYFSLHAALVFLFILFLFAEKS